MLLEKLERDTNVFGTDWILTDFSRLVERQVEKPRLLAVHAERLDPRHRFSFADAALDGLHFLGIDLTRNLRREKSLHFLDEPAGIGVRLREIAIEPSQEIHISPHLMIEHRNVAG